MKHPQKIGNAVLDHLEEIRQTAVQLQEISQRLRATTDELKIKLDALSKDTDE